MRPVAGIDAVRPSDLSKRSALLAGGTAALGKVVLVSSTQLRRAKASRR